MKRFIYHFLGVSQMAIAQVLILEELLKFNPFIDYFIISIICKLSDG